ncbi:Metabotropic glutamate receptor 3 [Chytriomyces hyalinus]|nr:Metabotropic glutamate receptor 3 [Chytriomyces hyalinus]
MDGSYVTTLNISAGLFSYADIQVGPFDAWTYFVDIGIQAAIESINRDASVLPGIDVNIKRFSDCGSWKPNLLDSWPISTGGFASSVMAHDIVDRHEDVIGVVGLEDSSTTRGSASVLSIGQIPYCSGAAASPRFSDKAKFPYFWRTISHSGKWHWQSSLSLAEFVGRDAGYLDILHTLQQHSISIQEQFSLSKTANAGIHDRLALTLRKISARYIIILGNIDFTAGFMNAMGVRGMINRFHVYIGDNVPWPSQDAKLLYGENYFSYLKGFIQFTGFISERTKNYYKSMAEVAEKLGHNVTEVDIDYNNIFLFFDCVKSMAYGMNSLLQGGASPAMLSSRQLNYEMDYRQFQNTGYSGNLGDPLLFDDHGDIRIYTGEDYNTVLFAQLDPGGLEFTMYNESLPIFFDGGSTPPRDGPPMLPQYDYTSGNLEGICLIVLIVLGVATASFSAVVLFMFRTRRIIRSSSVPEMLMLSAGSIVIVLSLVGYLGPSSTKSCSYRIFFIFIGFTLFATPLIAKTAKIYVLSAADRRLKETEARRIAFVSRAANCVVTAIAMTISVCWIVQARMSVLTYDTLEVVYTRCVESGPTASSYALYSFAVILLLGLCASSIFFGAFIVKIISASSNARTDFFMAVIIWAVIMTVFSMVVLTRLYALFSERQTTARFPMHTSHAVKVSSYAVILIPNWSRFEHAGLANCSQVTGGVGPPGYKDDYLSTHLIKADENGLSLNLWIHRMASMSAELGGT